MTVVVAFVLSFLLLPGSAISQAFPVVAGTGDRGFSGDGGPAVDARLSVPSAVFVDVTGTITIADTSNDRVRIIEPDGRIRTIAGNGDRASTGDGGPATDAALHTPTALFVDGDGNIFVAEWTGHRIRKISPSGTITTTVGIGLHGFLGDGGPSTESNIWSPSAIYIDGQRNLYLAEWGNDRIRKVAREGTVSTLAGTGIAGFTGDGGPATEARINNPNGIFVDKHGNVYFSDLGNQRVRRITTDGRIETVAGDGTPGFAGDGGPATEASISNPAGLFLDDADNLYLVDSGNGRIRKIDPSGTITTVVGGAVSESVGSLSPKDLTLEGPTSLFVDAAGDLLVAEGSGHRIRRFPGIAEPTRLPGAQPKTSDFNDDSVVGFRDFLLFVEQFGKISSDSGFDIRFDLLEDGRIDFNDFIRFALAFGTQA